MSRIRGSLAALALLGACAGGPEPERARAFLEDVAPRSTSLPAEVVAVPFDLSRGVPVVQVRLGEHPAVPMVLDTGTAYTSVSPRLAAALSLAPAGTLVQRGARLPVLRLPRLDLGDASFLDLGVVVQETTVFPGVEGVLGLCTFAQSVLEVDGPARVVRIRRDGLELAPDQRRVFTWSGSPWRPEVPLHLQDASGRTSRFRLLVDTGCPRGIDLPDIVTELPFVAEQVDVVEAAFAGGKATRRVLRLRGVARVGAVTVENPLVLVYAEGQRWDDLNLGMLGMDVLSQLVVRLDPTRRRVQFVEPAAPRQ